MNFDKTDMWILMGSLLAVIFMSLVFPPLGLADQEAAVNQSEIPTFDIDTEMFDFRGELPREPGTAETGELIWYEDRDVNTEQQKFLSGDSTNGLEIVWVNFGNATDPEMTFTVNEYVNGPAYSDQYTLNYSEAATHQNNSWTIHFRYDERLNQGEEDFTAIATYQIGEEPEETSTWDRIPGTTQIDNLYESVAWIAATFYYGLTWVFEIGANLLAIFAQVFVFMGSSLLWIITTYAGIISAADGVAALLLGVPSALLSYEFAKIGMLGIKMLPST